MKAEEVVAIARSFIKTPFVHRGRTPSVGLDCAGLIVCTAQALGIEHFDVEVYGRIPLDGLLEQALLDQPSLEVVADPAQAQPGDVLLMRFGAGSPRHLAMLAGKTIIHSYAAVGQVGEHDLTQEWKARIVRVHRFVGVES